MLLVIFGAGASYDSVPSRPPNNEMFIRPYLPYRPPLADELFGSGNQYLTASNSYPRVKPIIPRLQRLPEGRTVEAELERLQEEADDDPERLRQLAAIRYYLHYLITDFTRHWENEEVPRGDNYRTLLDDIRRWRKGGQRVCLVTFNYDTLLESALYTFGHEIRDLPHYIAPTDFKVIKLHGSTNWAREVDTPIEVPTPTWNQVSNRIIELAPELKVSSRYRLVGTDEWPVGKAGSIVLFPALAIPLETKRDFECPQEHLDALQACLPQVTELLVIGWRAADRPFLQLLRENVPPHPRVMVVAGGQLGGEQVIQKLREVIVGGDYAMSNGGFTEFVLRREVEGLLRQ